MELSPLANAFDPYREALVVEQHTVWSDEYEDWPAADKDRVAAVLPAAPRPMCLNSIMSASTPGLPA